MIPTFTPTIPLTENYCYYIMNGLPHILHEADVDTLVKLLYAIYPEIVQRYKDEPQMGIIKQLMFYDKVTHVRP